MTLKELSQLYHLNKEITKDQERLDALRHKSFPLGSKLTGMPGGGNFVQSVIDKNTVEVIDLEGIIEAKVKQCLHERNRLERYISDISDSLTRQIFTLRFINGMSWVQVAHHIGGGNTEDGVKKICYRYINKTKEI